MTVPAGVLTGDASQLAHVKFWGGVAATAAVGSLVVLFALAGHPERLGRAAGRVERVLPARAARIVAQFVETFAQGLAVLRQPARLAVALLQSFPIWLSIAAGIWLTSQAFSITFPYSGSFLVMTLLVVGVAMPTPGQIGGFHAAYQVAVQTFFGAPDDRAIGAAIVLHAVSFIPVTLLGVAYMAGEGLTLKTAKELASSGTP
ncbi:MAG: flippase-like domain-containing protein [Acidobacteria bacterium]|nr:flippase-like domain-containing protein [Acidobacteriota bacterium]